MLLTWRMHIYVLLNNRLQAQGCRAWNIGTGNGSSVLQVKNTFEQVNGVPVAFEFAHVEQGMLRLLLRTMLAQLLSWVGNLNMA